MRRLTASQLQRIVGCPASAVLPAVIEQVGDKALRGTGIHRYLQVVATQGKKAALSSTPKGYHAECNAIDVDWIVSRGDVESQTELAFRYNVFSGTARCLGTLDRDYPDPERGDLFVTVDLVQYFGAVRVVDYKTGQRVTACGENWQMKLAALAATGAFGRDATDMRLAYLEPDGSWDFDDAHADTIDLDGWAADLKATYLEVETAATILERGGVPDVRPTEDGCRWCPCWQSCPAKTAQIVALRSELATITPTSFAARLATVEAPEAGKAWTTLKLLERFVEAGKAALVERAGVEPLPLPSGNVLRVVEQEREYLDGYVAFDVIEKVCGRQKAIEACPVTASKSTLKVLGKDQDRVLKAIRAAGGVTVKTYRNPKEGAE